MICRVVCGFFRFFLLYIIFLVFSFKHRGVSGLLSPTTSDQQEKSQFGGFLAHVPQWKVSQSSLLKVGCPGCHQGDWLLLLLSHRTGRTHGQKGRAREKGNYMLDFADKMNLPAVPECLLEQKVWPPLVLSQAQINPCVIRSLPALTVGGTFICKSGSLLWLWTTQNLIPSQKLTPQAQVLKDGYLNSAYFSASSFFSLFLL